MGSRKSLVDEFKIINIFFLNNYIEHPTRRSSSPLSSDLTDSSDLVTHINKKTKKKKTSVSRTTSNSPADPRSQAPELPQINTQQVSSDSVLSLDKEISAAEKETEKEREIESPVSLIFFYFASLLYKT